MPHSASASSAVEQLPARAATVWAALDPLVAAGTALRVLDVGGGSGTLAVPLARLGHEVTVVDPSADALATLRRRADAAGVGDRVRAVQGDGDRLHELPLTGGSDARDDRAHDTSRDSSYGGSQGSPHGGSQGSPHGGAYDLALCHAVLEVVDDPAVTLGEVAGAIRSGGTVSVVTANRAGAVLARALGGHPVEALAVLADRDPAPARARPAARRFAPEELLALIRDAGLEPGPWRGVSVVADLLDTAAGAAADAVRRLELRLAELSPYRDIAAGLHVLAIRP